ncbi:MAG: peptidoglycan-binding domain-containing protein [Christensenella sp.]
MRKFICILIICLIFTFPMVAMAEGDSTIKQSSTGDEVALVQTRLRDLGYFNYRPTGKFSDLTANAVKKFQLQSGIDPDGQVGSDTFDALFAAAAPRAPINPRVKKTSGPGYSGVIKEKGELSAWDSITALIPEGSQFIVQDLNSGATFNLIRTGGKNCAYVTTPSAADYTAYRAAFGGADTWEHRAVLVRIGDTAYAASLFGMPTGGKDEFESGMAGHTFLYFNNSKTDISALPDEEHILSVVRTAGK